MKKKKQTSFFWFWSNRKIFLKELIFSKKKFSFCSTNTKKTKTFYFNKKKYISYKFKTINR